MDSDKLCHVGDTLCIERDEQWHGDIDHRGQYSHDGAHSYGYVQCDRTAGPNCNDQSGSCCVYSHTYSYPHTYSHSYSHSQAFGRTESR